LEQIQRIADKHNLVVIEDAAHALGATYKKRKIGSICDMTMFSFHPVKHITTGEGGIITTNNKSYYEKLLLFRTHGITRDSDQLIANHGPWYYEMQSLGFNYRMTDIQAALGTSQMNKIEHFVAIRRKFAAMYTKAFNQMPQIISPYQEDDGVSSWHLYIIRLRLERLTVDRKTIFEELLKHNIGVNVHYLPVYWHPYYQDLGFKKGICPKAEKLYNEIITLPLFPQMSDDDVQDVISAVQQVVNQYTN
jgi:perosamine synthetase